MSLADTHNALTHKQIIKWLISIIVLSALFYITARLGLILAIPPGYATAIWLPSGIALAFILLFGYYVSPAIWIGSFLVNYQMSGAFLVASSIALGSMLQAILGAYLVRRFVGFPNPLSSDKDIMGFLILGGPISCLFAATWGVSTLLITNQVPLGEFFYNWFTWWSGDTTGVLVFTPIILIWTAQPQELWQKRRLSVGVPLCCLFSILVVFFMYTSRWKDEKLVDEFNTQSADITSIFELEAARDNQPYLSSRFVDEMLVKASFNGLVLRIYDLSKNGNRRMIYSSSGFHSFNGLVWDKLINIKGHQWLLEYTTAQNFITVNQTWELWVVPISGVLLTALLGMLLLSITGKAAMIEGIVNKRTKELTLANDSLLNEIKLRHTMEITLEQHAKELARSNNELAQFVNIASHDLKEPLRMVVTYLQLLDREYHQQLDNNAKEYMYFAVDGAKRMQALISDLLTYSSVGAQNKTYDLIECEEIIQQVLEVLKFSVVQDKVYITNDPLPRLYADKIQMMQLFQNLIGNAIKFSNKSSIKIHIGVKPYKNSWLFWVQDNGIGISTEYFGKIFEIFQRLHGPKEYQGSGIGLAVCKKIVEQHGGQIWVESSEGLGSTFYFTLPIQQSQEKIG